MRTGQSLYDEMDDHELISICIICYNQDRYILEALEGAINQRYKNIEIIISDDHSTDHTYNIIEAFVEKYEKLFKIRVNRNERRIGIAGNVNKAIEISKGRYILLAAGDDISLSNRVQLSIKEIKRNNVLSVIFNANIIDSNSERNGTLFKKNVPSKIFRIKDYLNNKLVSSGPTRIIDRKIIEIFGPINDDCPTEDSVFNLRAILAGGLEFCNEIVIDYRIHDNNVSRKHNLLTNIDPIKICNQYKKDLGIAFYRNLINAEEYDIIYRSIVCYKHREIAKRDLYNISIIYKIRKLIKYVLSTNFNIKDKIDFIKIFIYSIKK